MRRSQSELLEYRQQIKKKDSPTRIFLFCCQTRTRRSDYATCNDYRKAILDNRISSLSPQIGNLRGPLRWVRIHEFSKKRRTPERRFFFFVAKLGLEPRQTEPESVVLPLHHLAIKTRIKSTAKVLLFS